MGGEGWRGGGVVGGGGGRGCAAASAPSPARPRPLTTPSNTPASSQDFPSSGLPAISKLALLESPAYRDPGVFERERFSLPQPSPGVPLDAGDARTLQAVYSGGRVWVAAQTAVRPGDGVEKVVGAIYWVIDPAFDAASHAYTPAIVSHGYVVADGGRHVARPAITAAADGRAWMAVFVTGSNFSMSPGVVEIDLEKGGRRFRGDVGARAIGVLWRRGSMHGARLDPPPTSADAKPPTPQPPLQAPRPSTYRLPPPPSCSPASPTVPGTRATPR